MGRGIPRPLETGETAPAVSLVDAAGAMRSLDTLLASGPVLLAFFKVCCPTCQLTLPFLGRLADGNLQVVQVSQDSPAATQRFAQEFRLTIPALFDREEDGYPASNAFGISVVPSIFLVEQDRRISWDLVGFHRKQLELLAGRSGQPIFYAGEMVPELKAG
jgi:peroxiredoxin